jgi:hypothetical protein
MALSTRHITAVLRMPRQVKQVGAFGTAIVNSVNGNPFFPSPTPPIATIQADIAALVAAEAAVLSRTKGAAETRNAKLVIVKNDLQHLMDYVQGVADNNPSDAEAIIQSAGLAVRKIGTHTKNDLEAEQGEASGTVKLTAKAAAARASYEWSYSLDQKTWTTLPVTLQAKTVVTGLPSGSVVYFRVRPVTKSGEGATSQAVSLLVQ